VGGQRPAELGIGRDRRVPDPVDRLDAVADPDRVQAPPCTGRPDAGVDLEVQVTVRITGAARVVPDHRGLDLLDRDLHLPSARPDSDRGVLRDPADDLGRRLVLRRIQRRGDLRVQGGCEGPGLRAVHHDLDEPQPLAVGPQPTFRQGRLRSVANVESGDPLLVGVAVHATGPLDPAGGCGDEQLDDAAALGEVVVIGPRTIGLDIGPSCSCGAVVELHSAMHADHRLDDVRRQPTDP